MRSFLHATLLASALLAACGGSHPSPGTANVASQTSPPATVSQPATCDTAECFVAALDAGHEATLRYEAVSDEGGHTITTYSVVGNEVEVVTDDRDDGFAASPGIHTQRCIAAHAEPLPDGGSYLAATDCRDL